MCYFVLGSGQDPSGLCLAMRHPSTADTHDITDNSESPDRVSKYFNTLETLKSRHPATPYNGHSVTPIYTLVDLFRKIVHLTAGVNNLTLD